MPILSLRRFGVAFGEKAILRDITLEVRARRLVLMGHSGAGKSTLLRTLAGWNDAQPELRVTGEVVYQGIPLQEGPRPWLVGQKATLLLSTVLENLAQCFPHRDRMDVTEQRERVRELLREAFGDSAPSPDARVIELPLGVQRCLAIARGVAGGAALLMADEPTAGLSDAEQACVISLLERESERRHVCFVTHNQKEARAFGGDVALFVNGRLTEAGPTMDVLLHPKSYAARQVLRTGACYIEEPPQETEERSSPADEPARAAKTATSKYLHWVLPQKLLGMPRPGLVRDIDEDLSALKELGVSVVFTLEETKTIPEDALDRHAMTGVHIPIHDMGAPTVEVAKAACAAIALHLSEGRVVAVHCLGGAGRTGLLLASYFIYQGRSALDALEAIRRVQPRFVQSEVQVLFLSMFESACRDMRSRHAGSVVPSVVRE